MKEKDRKKDGDKYKTKIKVFVLPRHWDHLFFSPLLLLFLIYLNTGFGKNMKEEKERKQDGEK